MPRRTGRAEKESFGAGLVAGASDNDPTTVATLAVVGSTTVYALSWLVLLVIPMLIVIQSIAAQIGTVSKRGLEDCIRTRFGPLWAFAALGSLLVVNVLTLAADLEGGGAALGLLTGVEYRTWLVPLGALTVAMLLFGKYHQIERVLRYSALLFLTYVAAAFMAHPDWSAVLHASFVPHLDFSKEVVAGALALLGTTLTAYAYVWETIELSEERPPVKRLPLVELDAALGIVVAGLSFWFILIATAATLGVHHERVETAQQAARALEPFAGKYASAVFAIGLLGSALVAVPVLASTSAFVISEMFGWEASLNEPFTGARPFYLTLTSTVVVALAIGYAGISPIKILFYSGIAGGIATPLTMALMILLGRDRKLMGKTPVPIWLSVAGWIATAIVTGATLIYLYQSLAGG